MTAKLTQVTEVALEECDKYRVTPARFTIHPVAFSSAPERYDWTHEHTLQPGETLPARLERDHDKPYHLRFRSAGPVQAAILNDAPGAEPDRQHGFTLDGTCYASLHAPRREDVIVIKNEGAAPIQVSGLTEHPAAISHKVEGPGRLAPGTEIGTLDAIHLATALLWREHGGGDLVMATHDAALATPARACGLAVVGGS